MSNLKDVFWHEGFWLPPNVTWNDLEDPAAVQNGGYTRVSYLLFTIPLAFIPILIRLLLTKHVFGPVGIGKNSSNNYVDGMW